MRIFSGVKESRHQLSNLCLEAWYRHLLKHYFNPATIPYPSAHPGPPVIYFFSSSTYPMVTLISLYYNYFLFDIVSLIACLSHQTGSSVKPACTVHHCTSGAWQVVSTWWIFLKWMNCYEWKMEWNGLLNQLFFPGEICHYWTYAIKIINSSIS